MFKEKDEILIKSDYNISPGQQNPQTESLKNGKI